MPKQEKENAPSSNPLKVKRPQLMLPESLEPSYANVVRISHTPAEMVFDFGQLLPGTPNAPVKSRVLMSPLSAKLLQRALTENLAKYEALFGEIKIPQGKSLADNLFAPLHNPDKPDAPDKDEE